MKKTTLLLALALSIMPSIQLGEIPEPINVTPIVAEDPVQTEELTPIKTEIPIEPEDQETYTIIEPIKLDLMVTYYTDQDNALEGGKYDRRGKILAEHDMPVIAMPKDVPYGSYLYVEDLHTLFKVVDTGGAMVWTGENQCNVDVFIAGKTTEWLNKNTGKHKSAGYLYVMED